MALLALKPQLAIASGIGTAASFTPTRPAGSGGLLILQVGYESGSNTTFTSSQWTTSDDENQSTNIGHRVARRVDDGTTLTAITFNEGSRKYSWAVGRITGADPTTPEDVAAVSSSNTSGSPDPGSIDPVTVRGLIIAFCATQTQTTFTPPTDYTEWWDVPNTVDGTPGLSAAFLNLGDTHAAQDPGTFTPGSATPWVATTIAIRNGFLPDDFSFAKFPKPKLVVPDNAWLV